MTLHCAEGSSCDILATWHSLGSSWQVDDIKVIDFVELRGFLKLPITPYTLPIIYHFRVQLTTIFHQSPSTFLSNDRLHFINNLIPKADVPPSVPYLPQLLQCRELLYVIHLQRRSRGMPCSQNLTRRPCSTVQDHLVRFGLLNILASVVAKVRGRGLVEFRGKWEIIGLCGIFFFLAEMKTYT